MCRAKPVSGRGSDTSARAGDGGRGTDDMALPVGAPGREGAYIPKSNAGAPIDGNGSR